MTQNMRIQVLIIANKKIEDPMTMVDENLRELNWSIDSCLCTSFSSSFVVRTFSAVSSKSADSLIDKINLPAFMEAIWLKNHRQKITKKMLLM